MITNGKVLVKNQKQPPRGDLRKKCSENMRQIYRRTPRRTPQNGCFCKVSDPVLWDLLTIENTFEIDTATKTDSDKNIEGNETDSDKNIEGNDVLKEKQKKKNQVTSPTANSHARCRWAEYLSK